MSVLLILGIVQIVFVGTGILVFLYLLGLCFPSWNEPYPRVTQFSYPSVNEKHWLLQFVNQTAILKQNYVISISEFVGARGTFSNKLMIMMTTGVGMMQIFLSILLFDAGNYSVVLLVLACISGVSVITIGFCESSLLWTLSPSIPKMSFLADQAIVDRYNSSKEIYVTTADEDTAIKNRLDQVHVISALSFIFLQFAIQIIYQHSRVEIALTSLGLFTFVIFCFLQWLSGSNDDSLGCLAIKNLPPWMKFFYYPQGMITSERGLKLMSWSFLSVELISFTLMSIMAGVNGIMSK